MGCFVFELILLYFVFTYLNGAFLCSNVFIFLIDTEYFILDQLNIKL